MKLCDEDIKQLIALQKRGVYLEGSILKVLEASCDEFKSYLDAASERDKNNRKKRLEVTKQVQAQNAELLQKEAENQSLMEELKGALQLAEDAKNSAEEAKEKALDDLEVVQQKTQFELIGLIVKVALYIIAGVGIITTLMYVMAIWLSTEEAHTIGTAWNNMLGILLTNAFSIVGTIMGVKYASEKKPQNNQ